MEKIVRINKEQANQSKAQKEFNRLVDRIEKLEKDLVEYRAGIDEVYQRIQRELMPVREDYYVQKVALVKCFDRAYGAGFLKKRELKKLSYLICKLAYDAIEHGGKEELIPIYDKYNEEAYEEETERARTSANEYLKDAFSKFGVEPEDEIDMTNPQGFQEQMAKNIAEEQSQAEERSAKRPKTKKQEEKKKELKARSITKSVRTIYVDLVKAFHPDLESDTEVREHKTQIMHRITEAYEKNDLLGLLRLQLEFDRIDQNHIENLAESHLKNFNKLLYEQAVELNDELDQLVWQMASMSGKPASAAINLHQLRISIGHDIKELKNAVNTLKKDTKAFESHTVLNNFLKNYPI